MVMVVKMIPDNSGEVFVSEDELKTLSSLVDSEDNINLSLYGVKVDLTEDEKKAFSFVRGMLVSDVMLLMVRATRYFIEKYKNIYAPENKKDDLNENIKVCFISSGDTKRSMNCLGCYSVTFDENDASRIISEKISYYAESIYDLFLKGMISELGGCNIVIHEVSHYIDRAVNGNETHPNPNTTHGRDWSKIVNQLGGTDEATLETKEESKSRVLKVYIYKCVTGCEEEVHIIKNSEHGKIIKKEKVGRCKKCKVKLKYCGIEFVVKDGKITNDLSRMDLSKIIKFYEIRNNDYKKEVNILRSKAERISKSLNSEYMERNNLEIEEIDM